MEDISRFIKTTDANTPVHPGIVVKNNIDHRGISQKELSKLIDLSPSTLSEVLSAKRPVTTEYALLFEAALHIDADALLNMQMAYNKFMARSNPRFKAKMDKVSTLTPF